MSDKAKAAKSLHAATVARQLGAYAKDRKNDHKRVNAVLDAEDKYLAAGGTKAEAATILKAAEAEAMRRHFR